jgi:hypothetical protein
MADPITAGSLHDAPAGEGIARQLVRAVESLRPGTRQLSDGQQSILAEYEYIVEQLRPPTFTPPAPEISGFVVEDDKTMIFGKHLRGAITVTIAHVRSPKFRFKEAGGGRPSHLEATVPEDTDPSTVVVLTAGGTSVSTRRVRAVEEEHASPSAAAEPGREYPDGS